MHNGPELIGLLVPPSKVAALRNIANKENGQLEKT